MQIKLGATYTDIITGFVGIATGHVEYLTGCHQTLLTPKCGKDNSKLEPQWFDDDRLTEKKAKLVELPNRDRNGFDKAAPIR